MRNTRQTPMGPADGRLRPRARRAALWGLMLGLAVMGGAAAAADQPGMASGGAQRPPGGDRTDEQQPQLGTGNRGSGQRAVEGTTSVNPSRMRKDARPGTVTGDVLAIDGTTYIIRDAKGNELALKTDEHTRIDGMIRIGARVTADVETGGRVASLRAP